GIPPSGVPSGASRLRAEPLGGRPADELRARRHPPGAAGARGGGMNILAIGAHPDDVEFGCGGTLIKYAAKGAAIALLVMTDGARGGNARTRRAEQARAARVLGATETHWGGYRDTLLPSVRRLIDRMEQVI